MSTILYVWAYYSLWRFVVTTSQFAEDNPPDPNGPQSTTISQQAITEANKPGARGGERKSNK